jgi:uncharacterized lipoprotein YmbA
MRATAAVLAALSVLPACLGPRTDTARYFTLPAAGPPSGATPIPSLGLGPVVLPPYLSRPEVATRLGPEQVAYSPNDRWAAPLEDLAVQALGEELRARLPAREVLRWPWPLGSPPDVTVAVEFLRFEGDGAGGATLRARWTVTRRGNPPVPGETRFQEAGKPGDVPGSVAALGRGLGVLAADLAGAARGPAN